MTQTLLGQGQWERRMEVLLGMTVMRGAPSFKDIATFEPVKIIFCCLEKLFYQFLH
jgi:hypothetical protein